MPILFIQGKVDTTTYKEVCKKNGFDPNLQKCVFIFPGNSSHHTSKTTLFSVKGGGGLAAASAALGSAGYPTLSLPTTSMEQWSENSHQKTIVDGAIAALYKALGAGYQLMLPVRAHKNTNYFDSPIEPHALNVEPSFWGGIQVTANKELANYYTQQLNILSRFMSQSPDEQQKNVFFKAYLEGQNMSNNDRWLKPNITIKQVSTGKQNSVENFSQFINSQKTETKTTESSKKKPKLDNPDLGVSTIFDSIYEEIKAAQNKEDLKEGLINLCDKNYLSRKPLGLIFIRKKDDFNETIFSLLVKDEQKDKIDWLLDLANVETNPTINYKNEFENLLLAAYYSNNKSSDIETFKRTHSVELPESVSTRFTVICSLIKTNQLTKIRNNEAHLENKDFILPMAFAYTNSEPEVENYLNDSSNKVDTLGGIISGYLLSNNTEKAKFYSDKIKDLSDNNQKEIYTELSYFYAFREDHAKVEEYRNKFHSQPSSIGKNYFLIGNFEKAEEYSLEFFLGRYLNRRKSEKDGAGNTKETLFPFFTSMQIKFKDKEAAVNALRDALDGKQVDLEPHLPALRNGRLGKGLRRFVKSGMANEFIEEKVNTVSDFIRVLNKEVNTSKLSL